MPAGLPRRGKLESVGWRGSPAHLGCREMPGRELEGALRPYLFSGERLLWTGAPAAGLRFAGPDIFRIPFSLIWLAAVTF